MLPISDTSLGANVLRRFLLIPLLLLGLLFPSTPPSAQSRSPKDVVTLFMEVYGTERMRAILPYTTPAFRDGLEPEPWLKRTYRILRSIGYIRLEGAIKSVVVKGSEATVVVGTRIRTKGVAGTQTEIFRLQLTDHGWKLLDLEVQDEVIEEPPAGSVS